MSQFILPARATDANNNPLSGALLSFYLEGTSTEVSTYSDYELNTEHQNPVVANSGGQLPPIYLNPDVSYRAVLKSALGITIDEFDPYSPSDSNLSSVANYGAVGDGVADDTATLQAALNTGRVIALKAGATYLISSGLSHVTGAGFVCFDGVATIMAKTGVGGFNIKTSVSPRTGLDRNMLFCNATDNLTLLNIHFTTDNITPVELHGVRLSGGMGTAGYNIQNISFSRFFVGSLVSLASIGSGRKRNLHISSAVDCGTSEGNTYWASNVQTTVVEIDNDIIANTPSKEGTIRIDLIRDILLSGAALTNFGQETDGVNIIHHGAFSTSGWDIEVGIAERIGELLDLQGFNCTARVGTAKFIYNDVVKLIHGASGNDVQIGSVSASGRSVVNIAGSSSPVADRDTKGNVVRIGVVTSPGTYGLGITGAPGDTMGVLFSNANATWKPVQNVVEIGTIIGDGVALDHIVKDGGAAAPNENLVLIGKASGWAVSTVSAEPTNVKVRYLSRCLGEMTMSADQTGIVTATATKMAFNTVAVDTEAIAVTGSNKFTLLWPGVYQIQASARLDAQLVGADDSWDIELRQNATIIRASAGKIYSSAKDQTATLTALVYMDENDVGTANADLTAWFKHDTGSNRTISSAAAFTRFSVARVA